ncbi:MAG: hypothetical protein RJQ08_02285 [Salinisphaeraceae bacterium]
MQRTILGIAAVASLAIAAGCGGDDNNVFNDNPDMMQPMGNSASAIVNQDPDDESLPVTDPDALRADLARVFGGPDDEPVEIGNGDTPLRDIVN